MQTENFPFIDGRKEWEREGERKRELVVSRENRVI